MAVISDVEYLAQVVHPVTQVVTVFDPDQAEWESNIERPSGTYAVPGGYSYIDPRGGQANALAPRVMHQKFVHYYAPGETYTSVYRDFLRAFGHGENMQLYLRTSDGTYLYNEGKAIGLPKEAGPQSAFSALLDVTLALTFPTWRDQFANNSITMDSGAVMDDVNTLFDKTAFTMALTGNSVGPTTLNCIHNNGQQGSAIEHPRLLLNGPLPAPIYVYNLSVPVAGGTYQGFYWLEPLGPGDTLDVDPRAMSVTKNGVNAWDDRFQLLAGVTDWFSLLPGPNAIYVANGALGAMTTATAHCTISGGGVNAVIKDLGGAGYGVAPLVTFSGGGGSGAAATAVIANGVVTGFTNIVPGSGYASPPTVTLTAPMNGLLLVDWFAQSW